MNEELEDCWPRSSSMRPITLMAFYLLNGLRSYGIKTNSKNTSLRPTMMNNYLRIAYFGGEPLGVPVLNTLKENGLTPELVIASPDRKAGRNLKLTPPPVKIWALENGIEVEQPENFKDPSLHPRLTGTSWDLFVVVAYNRILPEWLINLPKHGTINLHPSLLPKLRGPSPIRTAILKDKKDEVGATIILLDNEMDHGPILAQKVLEVANNWPQDGMVLDQKLADLGGELISSTIKDLVAKKVTPREQDHAQATYTKKFTRNEAELKIDPLKLPTGQGAYEAYLKIAAYSGIGGTFFFYNGNRIKITEACLNNGDLEIKRVIPEAKKEQDFEDWLKTL